MSEWNTIALDQLAEEITVGFVGPMATQYIEQGIPFLRSQNVVPFSINYEGIKYISEAFHNKLSKSALKPGDVVIVRTGKPGASAVIPKSLMLANCSDLVIVRCGHKLDPNFISYFINSITKSHVDANLVGAVQQHFNVGAAKQILVPDINIDHQRTIASILTSLDDKIALLHLQNTTLEKMAETLFRQMMSEHDSIRLQDGQDDASNKSCLSNNPENRVQDNVEEEAEEWKEIKITDLFEVKDGTHDSPKQKEVGKKLITSKHLSKHSIDFENAYYISEEDFEQINKRSKVDTGDILFSMIGTIGIIYLEQSKKIDYAIKNIGLFKTSQNSFWKYFTVLWLKSNLGKEFIHESRSGSTQEYISLGSLRSIIFYIPSIKKVELFNSEVEPIFKKIESNQTQIRTLTALRDTILPKLMSGEVRVSEHD